MSEFDWIFDEVSSGIKALIERFTQTPYFFYSEQDMHAYLYHRLISSKLGEFLVKSCFGDETVLIHREYPTLHGRPAVVIFGKSVFVGPLRAFSLRKTSWAWKYPIR